VYGRRTGNRDGIVGRVGCLCATRYGSNSDGNTHTHTHTHTHNGLHFKMQPSLSGRSPPKLFPPTLGGGYSHNDDNNNNNNNAKNIPRYVLI